MKRSAQLKTKNYRLATNQGFSLIELMVATSIFAIVMMVATTSLLTLVDANRKAQSLKSVMNNLNFALEHMSRSIRVGTTYHCLVAVPGSVPGNIDTPQNCGNTGGGKYLAFKSHTGDQVVYILNGTHLERSTDGGADGSFIPITAPEVEITNFSFHVTGAGNEGGTQLQPRVIMTLTGKAGVSVRTKTEFAVQTTITQRLLDFPIP